MGSPLEARPVRGEVRMGETAGGHLWRGRAATGLIARATACVAGMTLLVGWAAERAAGAQALPAPEARPPMAVVLLEGMSWEWLQRAASPARPSLRQLVTQEGAMAALNPFVPSAGFAVRAFAAVSSGVYREHLRDAIAFGPAQGDSWSAAVYERRTGAPVPGDAAWVLLDGPRMMRESTGDGPAPGWLGGQLREAGYVTAAIADAHWVNESPEAQAPLGGFPPAAPLALASLLAMDERGVVPAVQAVDLSDARSPGGLRTEWERVYQAMVSVAGRARDRNAAVFVVSGDLLRIAAEAAQMTPSVRLRHEEGVAEGLELLLRRLASDPYWSRSILVLGALTPAPAAPGEMRPPSLLTPLLWSLGQGSGSLLQSASTRRAGFIIAPDLGVSLAAAAGVPLRAALSGRPMTMVPAGTGAEGRLEVLRTWAKDREFVYWLRPRVMPALITTQVVALMAALGVVLARPGWERARDLAGGAALWAASVPAALTLPSPAWPGPLPVTGAPWWTLAMVTCFAAALALVAARAARRLGTRVAVILATVSLAITLADGVGALGLVGRSLMGYDLIAGARYYGIGNEHAGLVIGSSLLVGLWAVDRGRPAWAAAVLACSAAVLGWPRWGANVGESLAGAVATVAAVSAWRQPDAPAVDVRVTLRRAAVGALVGTVAVIATGLWDLSRPPGEQAHWGHALAAAAESGPGYLAVIAGRKLALNWRLIRFSTYTRIMVATMLVVMAAFLRAPRLGRRVRAGGPNGQAMLQAAAVSAFVALVANDSGVTSAATALLLPAAYVLEESLADEGAATTGDGRPDRTLAPA